MDISSQTSFIPKKPIVASIDRTTSGVNIFGLLGTIILLASIGLAVGVFLYESYLNTSLANMKQSFALNEKAFDPSSISTLTALSQRLQVAQGLLQNHIAPSVLFDILEESTLKSVRFNSFSYTYVGLQKITLTMKGQA